MKTQKVNIEELKSKADEIWTVEQFSKWEKSSVIRAMVRGCIRFDGYYQFEDLDTGKIIFVQ